MVRAGPIRSGGGRTRPANSGAAASNSGGPHNPAKNPQPVASPFAVLKENKQENKQASSFGGQKSGSFGVPSTFNTALTVDSNMGSEPRSRTTASEGSSVPVENASILSGYNERYEQVGNPPLTLDRRFLTEILFKAQK